MKNFDKNKVVLGLSGGVDSTTAALLLKEKGLEVTGLYFDVLGLRNLDPVLSEKAQESLKQAETVADQLGIEFIYKDMSDTFKDIVVKNFCNEYCSGRTPNPCIICNPNIKFKLLIEEADKRGAAYIATGHYAKPVFDETCGAWFVERASSKKKDQSYMLYRLGQDVISRLIFPLEGFEDKEKTRRIAKEHDLISANAKDSQEICFISDDSNYIDYIKAQHASDVAQKGFQKGDFLDTTGKVIGKHKGIIYYTIGQRKGLGQTFGKPMFVLRIDPKNNTVILGDNNELLSTKVISKDNFFTMSNGDAIPPSLENARVEAKIRYAAKPAAAIIKSVNDGSKRLETVFDEPQRAATPGQSIVFYANDRVIGGGFIE